MIILGCCCLSRYYAAAASARQRLNNEKPGSLVVVDNNSRLSIAIGLIFKLTYRYCDTTLTTLWFDNNNSRTTQQDNIIDNNKLVMLKISQYVYTYKHIARSLEYIGLDNSEQREEEEEPPKLDRIMFDEGIDYMNGLAIVSNPSVFDNIITDNDDEKAELNNYHDDDKNKNKFTFNDQIELMLDYNKKVKYKMLQCENSIYISEIWFHLVTSNASRITPLDTLTE